MSRRDKPKDPELARIDESITRLREEDSQIRSALDETLDSVDNQQVDTLLAEMNNIADRMQAIRKQKNSPNGLVALKQSQVDIAETCDRQIQGIEKEIMQSEDDDRKQELESEKSTIEEQKRESESRKNELDEEINALDREYGDLDHGWVATRQKFEEERDSILSPDEQDSMKRLSDIKAEIAELDEQRQKRVNEMQRERNQKRRKAAALIQKMIDNQNDGDDSSIDEAA